MNSTTFSRFESHTSLNVNVTKASGDIMSTPNKLNIEFLILKTIKSKCLSHDQKEYERIKEE